MHIVLASSSPRRRELLAQLGLSFTVDPSDADESGLEHLAPRALVEALSQKKAAAVAARHPDALVIGADTVVVIDGEAVSKPADAAEARRMLEKLSGREHRVVSGFTVLNGAKRVTRSAETRVWFRQMAPEEIDGYVKSGEPLDKAGAYGIQGRGAQFVERIEGDFYVVVGLPLALLAQELRGFGVAL